MSWTRILARGWGSVAWRVSIDGLPFEAVSHRRMEGTASNGAERYLGLRSDGFRFGENVHLPTSAWDAQGMRISFVDIGHRWTELFNTTPTLVTYLTADLSASGTTATVRSTAGWPNSGRFWLNSECISYVSKTATTFNGLSRGQFGSLEVMHRQSFGAHLRNPELTNWPVSIEGRRVRLYAYGHGDDPQGDGTQVWVGTARTEPSYDGVQWSFTVDALTSLFDFDLGADLEEPRGIRGIYYPYNAPLFVHLAEASQGITGRHVWTELSLSGFWETQEAFCDALTTAIAAACAAPTGGSPAVWTQGVPRAVVDGDRWAIQYVTANSGSERPVIAEIASPVDGVMNARPLDVATGARTDTVSPSTPYRLTLEPTPDTPSPGAVPRATLVNTSAPSYAAALTVPPSLRVGFDPALHPGERLYLSGPAPASDVTEVLVTWPAAADGADPVSMTLPVTATDTTSNHVDIDDRFMPGRWFAASGPRALEVEVRMTRTIAEGNLRDFLEALVAMTTTYVTTGGVPFLRPTTGSGLADIDLTDAGGGGEIDAASAGAGPIAERRKYTLLAPVSLRELIENECRLLGVYPCTNALGQITFKRLALPTPSAIESETITSGKILVDDQFYTLTRSPHGTYNTVVYRLGYDPAEDESTAIPVVIRDVLSFGRHPLPRPLTVEPKSIDPQPATIDELSRLASRVLGVFGAPYSELTIEVPLTLFNVLLGDVVAVTWAKLPSGRVDDALRARGTLGVTDRLGLVVSREWEPMAGKGTLTILLTEQRIGGYAPGARIASIDDGASESQGPFTVTLESTGYFPPGTNAETWFVAGDKIRVYQMITMDPSFNAKGTVTGVSGNTVTFTTDAPWPHALASWWSLGYDVSTSVVEGQRRFAFVAGSDGGLDWSDSSDNPPYTFGP